MVPQTPDAELQDLLAQVSVERIKANIEKLVSFGTRSTLSTQTDPERGIGAARDWIAEELRSYAEAADGRMSVEVPGYLQEVRSRVPFPVEVYNVQAKLEGGSEPDRVYVVTGHYDSRVSDVLNYEDDAPGANDDASGVAVSMELARILAPTHPKATLYFGAVAGEEQGLLGSNFMAETFANASVNVQAMFTNDIVGSSTGSRGEKDPYTIRLFAQGPPPTESAEQTELRLTLGLENDSPARELARFAHEVAANDATGMDVAVIYRLDRYLRGGDHRSFLESGYAAARFTEPNENFDHQHQDVRVENGTQYGDLLEFVDFEYVARVAKVNLATMWSLANAPGRATNVTIDTSDLTNNSTLSWNAPLDGDGEVAGYEIVWRSTNEPFWTHVVDIGMATTATVTLSKDNAIFGVRCVGTNGYKSPAVVPFPAE
ncbi:putative zinc metalloprotease [Lineolata rhizophorae]|uniref:Peptide hydrolase n=1 Tax=Lineolata rhizophorae TaxID=578093 RepID=A0A6A6NX48_9PEZI|nr:putative zinc metalloprotease [Lineolata rhizophorae]